MLKKLTQNSQITTPFYFYDQKIIERQIRLLNKNKPQNLEIFYAMKANSSLKFIQFFRENNFGIEIASSGELFLAQQAGVKSDQIIYTGPVKTDEELTMSVQTGIHTIHVESLNEAIRLNNICQKLGKKQRILVRVNSNLAVKVKVQLSGKPSPFGISQEDLDEILPKILVLNNLEFQGIHVFNASGNLDWQLLAENVENVFALVLQLEEKFAINCPIIDFGGGLGIDYSGASKHIDIQKFYQKMSDLITEYKFTDRKLIMEIGRYLTAECGTYVTKIWDKKVSRGKTFLLTDGGIHQHMRSYMFEQHPVSIIKNNENLEPNKNYRDADLLRPDNQKTEAVNITGCLCTAIDILAKDVQVRKVEINDFVAIELTGAYSLSASINSFLSHEMPMEIWGTDEHNFEIIRKRGQLEDLLLNQK